LKLKYPKPTFDPTGLKLSDETSKSAAKQVNARQNKSNIATAESTSGKH